MNIGEGIKQQRLRLGISQSELARAVGISQQNISRWENNTHIPDVIQCSILAKYFDVTLEELIGLNENDKK